MWDNLVSLGTWNWFIAAGLLLALEIVAPGTFMLWLGLAALGVGVISLFVDWTWQVQLVVFAVFAIAAIPLWMRLRRDNEQPTDQPYLNRRADAFVGRMFTLDKPIVGGNGTVRIGDTVWRIVGPDMPAGSRITVTKTDGGTLLVEAVG